jgi:hypothetical protein
VPYELVPNVMLPDNKLQPRFAKAGVLLERGLQPSITYSYFNMDDPVVGGFASPQVALRRAVGMAYNVDEEIRVIRNGQAVEAKYPIPPGVVGHQPDWKSGIAFDPAAANALLEKFGYRKGADGYRALPDGKPLVVRVVERARQCAALERVIVATDDMRVRDAVVAHGPGHLKHAAGLRAGRHRYNDQLQVGIGNRHHVQWRARRAGVVGLAAVLEHHVVRIGDDEDIEAAALFGGREIPPPDGRAGSVDEALSARRTRVT